jgi:16S rRNA processing protein RimM
MTGIEFITIGKIVNTHGYQGWLRIFPLTDYPERFYNMKKVFVAQDKNCNEYNIDGAKQHKNTILIKFKEINDMNSALALKGALLQVKRDQLVKLPADTYFIFDLLGMKVYTTEQEYLGEIKDVLQTGANDVYVVENGLGQTILIPALKSVVKEINFDTLQIKVLLPKGLR